MPRKQIRRRCKPRVKEQVLEILLENKRGGDMRVYDIRQECPSLKPWDVRRALSCLLGEGKIFVNAVIDIKRVRHGCEIVESMNCYLAMPEPVSV